MEQIRDQIRGLIATGQLAAGEPLPSVRQLAKDLAIAPGTAAKAYRALEQEGLVETRIGGGTRVSATASSTPGPVLDHARGLVDASLQTGVDVEDAVRIVRAIWPR